MEGILKICDHCKTERRKISGHLGDFYFRESWITVSRSNTQSNFHQLSAGTYHFCCDNCLKDYVNNLKIPDREIIKTLDWYEKKKGWVWGEQFFL